jgi:hypothetical protein
MRNIEDSAFTFPKNTLLSSWPIVNKIYTQRSLLPQQHLSDDLQTAIKRNGVFSGYGIVFEFMSDRNPRISFSETVSLLPSVESITFESYHFFDKTMAFHGSMNFQNPLTTNDGDESYYYEGLDCLLQFASNLKFLRDGYLRWKLMETSAVDYPLDGCWQVSLEGEAVARIRLQKHYFFYFGKAYQVHVDSITHMPKLNWSMKIDDTDYNVERTTLLTLTPGSTGPQVGENIEWTTNSPQYEKMNWKRLTMGLASECTYVRMIPNRFVYCLFQTVDDEVTLHQRPVYQRDTLWGNVFCQAFCVGLASYHFVTSDSPSIFEAYISYESPQTFQWPSLDNGTLLPSRVPFQNIEWVPSTRIFRGEIQWLEKFGTTWQGESVWQYEIEFDPTFMFVQSGTCTRQESSPHRFGNDLVYVNAALEDALRSFPRERLERIEDYLNRIAEHATDSTKQSLRHVIIEMQNGNQSVFDFNLSMPAQLFL